MSAAAPPRIVRCPGCGGASVYSPANRWRPFCSERCRTHDLGAWASERYRVAAADAAEATETDSPDDRPASPDQPQRS